MNLIDELRQSGIAIRNLDIGGGLGITYGDEHPPDPGEYARVVMAVMADSGLRLILEPGRVITGNAGILVAGVLYRKHSEDKEFVITDAGMNDLLRPSLYQAYHEIRPVVRNQGPEIRADVVGPICESSDFLAQDRPVPDFKPGDLLAVMSGGAYGFCMSSNYCSRPRVAEVMVKNDRFYVIRQRESVEDLVRGESLPPFMK
jgi:diaminopimelate decarboxylase